MKQGLDELGLPFKKVSLPTKMLIVSDGDIARNPVNRSEGTHGQLGWNEFERFRFANRDFLANAVEFLLEKLKQTKTNSDFFDSMNT